MAFDMMGATAGNEGVACLSRDFYSRIVNIILEALVTEIDNLGIDSIQYRSKYYLLG